MHVATVFWLLPLIAGILLLVVVGPCRSFCMCWSPFNKSPLQTAIGKFSGVVRASRRNGTSPAGFSRIGGWCCIGAMCSLSMLKATTIAVSGTERLTATSLSTEGKSFEPKPHLQTLCPVCLRFRTHFRHDQVRNVTDNSSLPNSSWPGSQTKRLLSGRE